MAAEEIGRPSAEGDEWHVWPPEEVPESLLVAEGEQVRLSPDRAIQWFLKDAARRRVAEARRRAEAQIVELRWHLTRLNRAAAEAQDALRRGHIRRARLLLQELPDDADRASDLVRRLQLPSGRRPSWR
jgi:hypothetical protein